MENDKDYVLGMNLKELSLRDLKEEIIDLKKELSLIELWHEGYMEYYEMLKELTFSPSDINRIKKAIALLIEEKNKRIALL